MHRVRELIHEVRLEHPADSFFNDFEVNLKSSRHFRIQYAAYDRAMRKLDDASWQFLKRKAIVHFPGCKPGGSQRPGQLKQDFFNHLNEAFAYEFLVRSGRSSVRFVEKNNETHPDIAYQEHGTERYCEVKTMGISDDEIGRRSSERVVDRSDYRQLSVGFLSKLDKDLLHAGNQIASQGGTGLVYVVVRLDDFTLTHYATYRAQLVKFLRLHSAPEVFVRVGITSHRRIYKNEPCSHHAGA